MHPLKFIVHIKDTFTQSSRVTWARNSYVDIKATVNVAKKVGPIKLSPL